VDFPEQMGDLARLLGEFAQPVEQPRCGPEIALRLAGGIGGLPDDVCLMAELQLFLSQLQRRTIEVPANRVADPLVASIAQRASAGVVSSELPAGVPPV